MSTVITGLYETPNRAATAVDALEAACEASTEGHRRDPGFTRLSGSHAQL